MILEVVKKRNYGKFLLYVYNSPEVAKAITHLTGRKTLTEDDVKALSVLGLELKIIDPYIMERELWKEY